ncbi:MAG TPA: urease accessory protein UreD [Chloroflexota bacterium]|jgi:urease accessory protein
MDRARSRLAFEARNGRTVLAASRTELPLAVQRPLRGPGGQAVVAVLTPSGALFDGDNVCLEVTCGPDTDVTLTTASATRLNRCDRLDIRFDLHVTVAEGATFRYLPHELIPFGGTRYRQRIRIDLHGDARAWLLEVVSAGQTGAAFSYGCLRFETTLQQNLEVVARERLEMTPHTAAQLRGHTHYASLFALGPEWDAAAARFVNIGLARQAGSGASQLPAGGIVVKAVGDAAEPLRTALLEAVDCPPWLRALLPP